MSTTSIDLMTLLSQVHDLFRLENLEPFCLMSTTSLDPMTPDLLVSCPQPPAQTTVVPAPQVITVDRSGQVKVTCRTTWSWL
ncbi:hypothetical protein RRG08_063300 [Elysia crispata]|uniref:Uncharacterized protein n=1 Tax=Elysia crispata TaxID=231223 RepID=A0AAE0Y5T4_9GAST|nr:hypothetical protein RRG08_063300 [Elysia crispata]